jgi:hypothetical protein
MLALGAVCSALLIEAEGFAVCLHVLRAGTLGFIADVLVTMS